MESLKNILKNQIQFGMYRSETNRGQIKTIVDGVT